MPFIGWSQSTKVLPLHTARSNQCCSSSPSVPLGLRLSNAARARARPHEALRRVRPSGWLKFGVSETSGPTQSTGAWCRYQPQRHLKGRHEMHTVTNLSTQIERIARPALEAIGDQVLLSQGRCVDVLLDLYCATDDIGLRWSIAERLHEISHLTAV